MHHSTPICARNTPYMANRMSPVISGFPHLGRRTRWGWNSSSYPQTRTIPSSPHKHVNTARCWPRSRRSRAEPHQPFMSNYIDKRTELIKQLTTRHKAYFNICKQELQVEISVLQDLICDIDYIIADLVYDKDFFNPRQLEHLEHLNKVYLEQLVQTEWELARINPPQWNESTETLQSFSEEEESN
jgi:hypothetical protein